MKKKEQRSFLFEPEADSVYSDPHLHRLSTIMRHVTSNGPCDEGAEVFLFIRVSVYDRIEFRAVRDSVGTPLEKFFQQRLQVSSLFHTEGDLMIFTHVVKRRTLTDLRISRLR